MRRAARKDSNHKAIADYLSGIGWSVLDTSALGSGFPDLVVGCPGFAALAEVKDGSKPPSKRKLTEDEQRVRDLWKGPYVIATSPEQANEDLMRLLRESRGNHG